MVRLKDIDHDSNTMFYVEFQFQSGAVKSELAAAGKSLLALFQFQSGAVKSIFFQLFKTLIQQFQFQSGAVKRSHCGLVTRLKK